MGLTKERKIFLGLATVAGIALIADQGIFATQGASAQAFDVEALPVESIIAESPAEPTTLPAAKILIDRLSEDPGIASSDSLGSIFSLTKLIEPQVIDQEFGADDSGGLLDQLVSRESFALIPPQAQDLPVLSAVMPSKSGGGAVVNGKILRIDQVNEDGYRLVEVKQRAVIVERDGVKYTVEIPKLSGD